jgi:chemotaxis protein MotB
MRRKRNPSHENHERWLVSYADFITLLFAFFVVMFASTQTDKSKAQAVSEAIERALADSRVTPKLAAILGGTVDDRGKGNALMRGPGGKVAHSTPDLADPLKVLTAELKDEIKKGNVQLKLESRGLIIGLNTSAFFPSGDDAIYPSAYPSIAKVAAVLNRLPNPLRLEGHTDSVPINTPRFQSNWELSAARSIAMLRVLNEKFGVERSRMAIVGYADTASIDSNATEEGRGRNRRVDIVVVSEFGMRVEPPQTAPPKPNRAPNG